MQYLQNLLDASSLPKEPSSSQSSDNGSYSSSNDNASSGDHWKENVDEKARTKNNQSVPLLCPESSNEYLNQNLLKFAEIKHKNIKK